MTPSLVPNGHIDNNDNRKDHARHNEEHKCDGTEETPPYEDGEPCNGNQECQQGIPDDLR